MAGARKPDWPAIAERVGRALPRTAWHAACRAFADTEGPAARGRWAVAFSGGADSLALLLMLWALGPEQRERLVALHFDHRLRGAASRMDARFCERVCAALGVTFVGGEWAGARKDAGEAEARGARMTFFEKTMRRRRIRALWLGHQRDDIAESMLMRLARGSGTAGLAAPRPVQARADGRVHLRPLLTLDKARLAEVLRAAGAEWREDGSNATGRYFRNRVRSEVVPVWESAAGRDARAGAALARERLEEDDEALEAWSKRAVPEVGAVLPVAIFREVPRAVGRRVLHRWLGALRPVPALSRQAFEQLLAVAERGMNTRFSLGMKQLAEIRRGQLSCRKAGRVSKGSRKLQR